jgi:hypothetical protein
VSREAFGPKFPSNPLPSFPLWGSITLHCKGLTYLSQPTDRQPDRHQPISRLPDSQSRHSALSQTEDSPLLHSKPAIQQPHPQPSVASTHRFTPYGGVWSCAFPPSLFDSIRTAIRPAWMSTRSSQGLSPLVRTTAIYHPLRCKQTLTDMHRCYNPFCR